MNTLRLKLVKTGVVEDNEYLHKYVSLVSSKKVDSVKRHKTQVHHIIPRAYFNHLGIEIDESENNRVILLYKDHLLAHYYLSLCAKGWFKHYAQAAVVCMVDFNLQVAFDIMDELEEYQHIYEQFKQTQAQHLSKVLTGIKKGNGHAGKKYMNNGMNCVCVGPEQFERLLSQGYVFGRITSDIARMNIRNSQKGKQKKSLQNVPKSEEHRNKLRDANIKRIFITNGHDEKSFHRDTDISEYLQNGWYVGRKPMTEEHKKKISEARRAYRNH